MDCRKLLLSLLGLAAALAAAAQNVSDLIVSEALVENTAGIQDGYGRHSGWIELTNTSQGTVNFAGCFLTDDLAQPRKYMISKGDASTKLAPRQAVVFWCSGEGAEGTYYTNFTLKRGGTVYLVSNDGKTVVDSLTIPEALPADRSVAKFARDNKGMDFRTEETPALPSPGLLNQDHEGETGAQRIARTDPHGWILTLTSVTVVFGALIVLWWLFSLIGRVFTGGLRLPRKAPAKAVAAKGTPSPEEAAAIALALDMEQDGDTYAAIALALHLYLGETVHDRESYRITFRTTPQKHLNFRKLPR